MIDIHSRVQAAQERLTSDLYELFREALAGMARDVGQATPVKPVAKKPVAKKPVAKKPVAMKPAARKAAPKKAEPPKPAPKPAPKKAEPPKPAAKKTAAKKVEAAKPAAPAKAAPAKPAAKKTAAPKPAKGKRIRRSLGQLKADADKVVKLLAANKAGLRIEQINKLLGTTTRQLARPILKLLEQRKIRKSGDRRATVYFPG